MEEPPSFCSTRSWTSYGFQIRTLKTALRPLDKKKQWRCCCMETVPFFTPRGKLILNKGAMPSISGLKGLSVCVNVVSKNTKLIWQNLNSAETKKKFDKDKYRARVAQWWEYSPPTDVARVQIPALTPYVGWVCCWFSPLLREVFLRVLRFSPLLKNQHFQIPIRSGTHGHV